VAEDILEQTWHPLTAGSEPEARRRGPVGLPAAAMPAVLVAALIFINESVFRVNDADQFSVDWQILLRLAVCGACGLYGLFYLRRSLTVLERFPALWLTLFGLWALATVPFAVNAPYAAVACLAFWCILLFVPALLMHVDEDVLQRVIVATLWVFVIGSWIMYFAVPELGRMKNEGAVAEGTYRLAGLTHANKLGQQVVLAMIWTAMAGSRHLMRRRWVICLLLLGLVTLVFTGSRTAMLTGALAASVIGLRGLSSRTLIVGGLGLVSLLVVAGLAVSFGSALVDFNAIMEQVSRTGDAEEIYRFTGRTEIWNYAVNRIAESPLLGYGYTCSRFVMGQASQFQAYHAHNLLLDVTLGTGIPGGLFILAATWMLVRALVAEPCAFVDTITLVILIAGLTEPTVFSAVPNSSTVFWIIATLWRPVRAQRGLPGTDLSPA
jgi:O-antigen ligase